MTAGYNIIALSMLIVVGVICFMYARVCLARQIMHDVYRVNIGDKWQRWAIKVLFPHRPYSHEPRVISPGTHLALYRVRGIYYYRELEHIYPMWDGKGCYVCQIDFPPVLDFVPGTIDDACGQDLMMLTAGKKTRITVDPQYITLFVDNVEEIRVIR